MVSQIYADGWEATVDGLPVAILATDHALQGIPVEAGQHVVQLRYRPASLRLGLWVSASTLLALVAVLGWRGVVRFRRRYGAVGSRPSRTATLAATDSRSVTK